MSLEDIMTAGVRTRSRIHGKMRPSLVGMMVIEMIRDAGTAQSQAQPIENTERSMPINSESRNPGQGDKGCE